MPASIRYSNLKWFALLAASAISCGIFAGTARADVVALTFTGGSTSTSAFTRGFEFTISIPITVTSLGWWDSTGSGGLSSSHQVAIWDTSGDELLSATVASGTTDPLLDGFRFDSNLTGTATLAAGTYVIGGLSTSSDLVAYDVPSADVTLAPGVTYVQDRYNSGGSLAYPGSTQGLNDGVFGPSFTFVSDVPEPSAWALLGVGGVMLGVTLRQRRRAVPAC
jgi:hypothetical protein